MVASGGTQQFTIDASKNNSKTSLLNTNISLKTGDVLIVNVSSGDPYGTYYRGTHNLLTPFGTFYQTDNDCPNYEFPIGSLVGTLDGGKTFFPVGNRLEMTALQPDGNLSFVFWGDDKKTNGNLVTLIVNVKKKSDPNYFESDLQYFKSTVSLERSVFQDKQLFLVDAWSNCVTRNTPETLFQTNLRLQPGDLLSIDVNPLDFWALWTNNVSGDNQKAADVNANGRNPLGNIYGQLDRIKHKFAYGALVGSIDGGKTFFPVGTHLYMPILNAGKLSFACWDENYGDNAGTIRVYVKVVRNGTTITHACDSSFDKVEPLPSDVQPPPSQPDPQEPIVHPDDVSGNWMVIHQVTGTYLETDNMTCADGEAIQTWHEDPLRTGVGLQGHLWVLIKQFDGTYLIRSWQKNSTYNEELYLQASANTKATWTDAYPRLRRRSDDELQSWVLVPVSGDSLTYAIQPKLFPDYALGIYCNDCSTDRYVVANRSWGRPTFHQYWRLCAPAA